MKTCQTIYVLNDIRDAKSLKVKSGVMTIKCSDDNKNDGNNITQHYYYYKLTGIV